MDKDGIKTALFYFSFVMVFVYIALGLMFLFSSFFMELVPDSYRAGLGGVLIIYGVFRMYILVRMKKARSMYESQQKQRDEKKD